MSLIQSIVSRIVTTIVLPFFVAASVYTRPEHPPERSDHGVIPIFNNITFYYGHFLSMFNASKWGERTRPVSMETPVEWRRKAPEPEVKPPEPLIPPSIRESELIRKIDYYWQKGREAKFAALGGPPTDIHNNKLYDKTEAYINSSQPSDDIEKVYPSLFEQEEQEEKMNIMDYDYRQRNTQTSSSDKVPPKVYENDYGYIPLHRNRVKYATFEQTWNTWEDLQKRKLDEKWEQYMESDKSLDSSIDMAKASGQYLFSKTKKAKGFVSFHTRRAVHRVKDQAYTFYDYSRRTIHNNVKPEEIKKAFNQHIKPDELKQTATQKYNQLVDIIKGINKD